MSYSIGGMRHFEETRSNDNIRLLERFRDGDGSAFAQIYTRWFDPIYFLLRRLTGSEQDARDITQDVFGRLWEKRESLDVDRGVKSYLFSAARNSAIDHLRRIRAADNRTTGAGAADESEVSPFDLSVAKDVELLVEYAIANMPVQRRRVFELSYRDGLSHAQIALQLDISPKVVRDHIYHARNSIRDLLPSLILLSLFWR